MTRKRRDDVMEFLHKRKSALRISATRLSAARAGLDIKAIAEARTRLLERADLSREYAGQRNKTRWLGLFADGATVEDPVGAPVHTNLSMFYDAFISPNDIEFDVIEDWVDIRRWKVYRNVIIHIEMRNGTQMLQPAHICYSFNTEYQIESLKAYWNATFSSPRIDGVWDRANYGISLTLQAYNVFSVFGFSWGVQYFKDVSSAFLKGDALIVEKLRRAVNTLNDDALESLFHRKTSKIALPNGTTLPNTFLSTIQELKVLELRRPSHIYQSGNSVACRLAVSMGKAGLERGIAVINLTPSGRIKNMSLFWQT
eukprot:CAMPEP_0184018002 /NCGR_PEP_ID=MMETSP0954-20121128/7879_1 /TAXON_ID=627963 /ORGANISM="Aplanochytrium sp, Strain PBS07" /LENGTH=312 /DNA_ID=CAMNT_0026299359 /DNA_START=85 /DNA_END=1023 /DNA_ORIENTATION=+